MFKVASHAGVIHAHNQTFNAHGRPAGDAQPTASPFSQMLDDAADGLSQQHPKQVNDQPQTAQTGQPSPADEAQQPATAVAASDPSRQPDAAAPEQPAGPATNTDKTTTVATADLSVEDDQTVAADPSDDSDAAPAVGLANAAVTTEQSLPATVIAPVTPIDAQSAPGRTAASPAPTAPESQPTPEQPTATPAPRSDPQSTTPQSAAAPQQLASAAGAPTAPNELPAAPEHSSSDAADTPSLASAVPALPVATAKVTGDKTGKPAAANPNGSQTAAATQPPDAADAADANAASADAAIAANDQHRDRHAESSTEEKKDHAAIASAAAHLGPQSPETLSAPHVEAHAGDAAQTGKASDGMQIVAMQHPADGLAAASASSAPQPASTPETAAAIPLAGIAVEIAARAQAGRNRFDIRLDPPELGRIDVRLDIDHDGHVTSRLTVDRVETLDALRRDAGDLEQALQQAGFKTADNGMQFTLRDQSFAGRDQNFPAMAAARVVVPAPEIAASDTMPAGYGRMLRPGGGIDIRV